MGGGAELAHHGGSVHVVAGHVADGQGGAAAGQGDDVEPVAADLGRGLRGDVAAGQFEARDLGDLAGQQAGLQLERGGPLAGVVPGVVYGDRRAGDQVTGQCQVRAGKRPGTGEWAPAPRAASIRSRPVPESISPSCSGVMAPNVGR